MANLANYDTGGRCTLLSATVGALAPDSYRAIMVAINEDRRRLVIFILVINPSVQYESKWVSERSI